MDRQGIKVMSLPSHVRVVSLVLALSAVTGGWLLLEYSQRLPPQAPLTEQPSETSQEIALPQERTVPLPPKVAKPVGPALPKNLIATFKCEKGGRISYGDQPCANGAKVLAVTAEKEVLAPNPTANFQRMRARAAAMEAERLARDRQFDIAAAETAKITANAADAKANQCAIIDNAIASVDAKLRQPHNGQEGDFWTAERRKLTDRRFSLGC